MKSTMEKAKELFASMLAQRAEMYDYVSSEIKRGGFYYRAICDIFKLRSITIKMSDKTIRVEASDKIILFENNSLSLIAK